MKRRGEVMGEGGMEMEMEMALFGFGPSLDPNTL